MRSREEKKEGRRKIGKTGEKGREGKSSVMQWKEEAIRVI